MELQLFIRLAPLKKKLRKVILEILTGNSNTEEEHQGLHEAIEPIPSPSIEIEHPDGSLTLGWDVKKADLSEIKEITNPLISAKIKIANIIFRFDDSSAVQVLSLHESDWNESAGLSPIKKALPTTNIIAEYMLEHLSEIIYNENIVPANKRNNEIIFHIDKSTQAERKALYSELLEIDCLEDRPKGFKKALKELVLEGKIETRELLIPDENSITGRRYNSLGYRGLPIYWCLASPDSSYEKMVEILRPYSNIDFLNTLSDIVGYTDGWNHSTTLFENYKNMVNALLDSLSQDEAWDQLNHMFNKTLHPRNEIYSRHLLFPFFFERYNLEFEKLEQPLTSRNIKNVGVGLKKFFSGKVITPAYYTDDWFVNFFYRYQNRNLTPTFLNFLDGIYCSIEENQRIKFTDNKITYTLNSLYD
ncbi:MAG: hypothetical protein V4812_14140 [Pseudomonadota bacterium]